MAAGIHDAPAPTAHARRRSLRGDRVRTGLHRRVARVWRSPLQEMTLTMRSRQRPARDAVAPGDHPGRARAWPRPWRLPSVRVRALGYAAAAWCLGFAGVSGWQVAADLTGHPGAGQRYAGYASGLAIMGMLVLVLKLAGAGRSAAGAWADPGGGTRDPRPGGPTTHLTGLRVGSAPLRLAAIQRPLVSRLGPVVALRT
jgi:hypothetical protein